MIEDTAAKKATYEARQKVLELRKLMAEKYPDSVDQTYYKLIMNQIDTLMTLIRLSAEAK